MATFKTHLTTAVTVSGLFASNLLIIELATPKATVLYWSLGILGGILPDVDTRQSLPARLLFTGLGVLFASLVVLSFLKKITFFELLCIWLSIYLVIRYGLLKVFDLLTVHRGNFHSILAAILFGLLTVIIAYHGFAMREFIAWFSGLFVSMGYLTHLLLDEIYSVDLLNKKLKKSFGSALKVASNRYRISTFFLVLAVITTFLLTPSTDKVLKILFHTQTYQKIKTKIWSY
jgi:hypothetical protein